MLESIHNTLRVKPFVLHSAQVLLVVPLLLTSLSRLLAPPLAQVRFFWLFFSFKDKPLCFQRGTATQSHYWSTPNQTQHSPYHTVECYLFCYSSQEIIGKYLRYLHSWQFEREFRVLRWRYFCWWWRYNASTTDGVSPLFLPSSCACFSAGGDGRGCGDISWLI
jgi:hypothetical protein